MKRRIYISSNGDVWDLVKEATGRLVIVHQPNKASGGKPSSTDLGEFVTSTAGSPQRAALLDLIASLTTDTRIPTDSCIPKHSP